MKQKGPVRAALLLAYCIPFAFLSVWEDGTSGTMVFYGVMAAGFALLGAAALKTENIPVIYIGNVLSFLSSCAAAKLSGLAPMGYYFKPFTSHSLITAISIAALFLHTVILLACSAKRNRAGGK